MYNDAILACSISSEEPPPELAPAAARVQRAAMAKPHLNLEERIELEAALRAGDTQAAIAVRLVRSAGTISREVALNGGPGSYRAAEAHRAALGRRGAARRGDCAIDEHPPLRAEVHERLHRGCSPEEIAASLKTDHPDLPLMHTSHESIYRYVYVVARGALQRELAACLRRRHRSRKPRRRGVTATQGKLQDMC
jgi:IS30 family transposase